MLVELSKLIWYSHQLGMLAGAAIGGGLGYAWGHGGKNFKIKYSI